VQIHYFADNVTRKESRILSFTGEDSRRVNDISSLIRIFLWSFQEWLKNSIIR